MSRLILTFDDSASGVLKGARLADRVLPFGFRFVWGPLQTPSELENTAQIDGLALNEFCERFDAIELWADQEPNEQLQLVWLLDFLRSHANVIAKSAFVQTNVRIGGRLPAEWVKQRPRAAPIHNDHLEVASAAWSAWRAPTPVAWFDLLAQDLSALPQLRHTVLALLEELPMRATGLGATEMRMLELVAAGQAHPSDLFPGDERPNERRTYGFWEVGELLDGLAHCPSPAVSGLAEGPFDLALHDSKDRHDRYKKSRLSLTELGKAILAHSDDFSRHNPINRWWGGTELTNDRLWRWDRENSALIAP
jgi:hypothetical protein